jgi:uncharacterized membrane protein
MSTTACPEFGAALPSPCPSRPRWRLRAALHFIRQLVVQHRQRRRSAATQHALSTLDTRTLQDIGLGEWAAASRDDRGTFWTASSGPPY